MKAAAEEKEFAIQNMQYHEEVTCMTVITDGGWSKRSHKHTDNTLGGVAIIVNANTGNILHAGIRNKHCQTCTVAETESRQPKEHDCFKTWSQSSQEMEADIILDVFSQE